MSHQYAGRRTVAAFCLILAMTVAMAFGAAAASAAPAPIKIGAVVTEGASVGFPTTASRTLKAYFQDYNARGGFKGRKIELDVVNDGFAAEKNIAGTKRLIDEGAVALVGSQAILNCLGNAKLLGDAKLYSIGWGAQANCYGLKQWGAVTASIQTAVAVTAQYAKKRVGGKTCLLGNAIPGAEALWKRGEQILAKLGTKFAYSNTTIAPGSDPTPAVLAAKSAGCRSLQVVLSPPQTIQVAKAKVSQKIRNMDLFLVNGYDYKTLKGLGAAAEGNYFFSNMYPFTLNDSRSKAYRRFTSKHKLTPDFVGQQAYVSAQLFVKALAATKGAVTRQSIGAAIAKLDATEPMLPGRKFKFGGRGNGGAPIVGAYVVRVRSGKFVLVPDSELSLPASVRSLAGKV